MAKAVANTRAKTAANTGNFKWTNKGTVMPYRISHRTKQRVARLRHALLAGLACLIAPWAVASGDDGFSESRLAPEFHVVEPELFTYASGKPGVVAGSYWRIYQFLAWRAVTGQPLSRAELDSFVISGWHVAAKTATKGSNQPPDPAASIERWLAARKASGATSEVSIDSYSGRAEFYHFLNCPDDAFERASQTLNGRIKTAGAPWLALWRANQDTVFANCDNPVDINGKQRPVVLPAALPANAPNWLRHDHEYQTAAALFYGQQFDAARQRFLQIAKNTGSPWQPLGNYLATRCLIRKATLDAGPTGAPADPQQRQAMLQAARNELLAQGATFAPAQKLLGWVDARLRPQARLRELAPILASGKFDGKAINTLDEYLRTIDSIEIGSSDRRTVLDQFTDPMTDWISAMQAGSGFSYESVRETDETIASRKKTLAIVRKYWQAKREPWWLLPLLQQARPGDLSKDELQAVASVPASSPLWHSLQYHMARIALMQGRADVARPIVAEALGKNAADLLPSSRNRWLRLKLLAAASLEEFIDAAARKEVALPLPLPIPNEGRAGASAAAGAAASATSNAAGNVTASASVGTVAAQAALPLTDCDFHAHMQNHLSLAQLKLAYHAKAPMGDLAEVIWTRAIAMGDYATADEFTERVSIGRASTSHLYQRYAKAQGAEAKKHSATLILVNAPELTPNGQTNQPGCGVGFADQVSLHALWPAFLDQTSRNTAEREAKQLKAIASRSDWLGPSLLAYAKANLNDAEVPKALHFFIAATRLEHIDWRDPKNKGRPHWSKQAFVLLHKNYPNSDWARKTKYFY